MQFRKSRKRIDIVTINVQAEDITETTVTPVEMWEIYCVAILAQHLFTGIVWIHPWKKRIFPKVDGSVGLAFIKIRYRNLFIRI